MPTWIECLNNGLDSMWDFLRFHPEKPSVHDIEVLESYLDDLRTMMVQKNGGQEQYTTKTAGAIDFGDLEMTINSIVMQAMWIYLGHGFDMLKDAIKNELL